MHFITDNTVSKQTSEQSCNHSTQIMLFLKLDSNLKEQSDSVQTLLAFQG